jgi:hypothetical protein
MRAIATLACATALAACASPERDIARHNQIVQESTPRLMACVIEASRDAGAAAYMAKWGGPYADEADVRSRRPTRAQLADTSLATRAEAAAILRHAELTQRCRRIAIGAIGRSAVPGLAAIYIGTYSLQDEIKVALVNRKITWGDAARLMDELRVRGEAAEQAELQRHRTGRDGTRPSEPERRQAIARALAQWSRQQDFMHQAARAKAMSYAPAVTNCPVIAGSVACTMS